jgi:hypothetical protein
MAGRSGSRSVYVLVCCYACSFKEHTVIRNSNQLIHGDDTYFICFECFDSQYEVNETAIEATSRPLDFCSD